VWWPSPSDYQDTIQNPRAAFSDLALRDGVVVSDALGLPKPISGSFATVYQVEYQGQRYAVRCFLRHVPDIAQRYAAISAQLQKIALPYMVEFRFLPQGIRLRGQWFPILKMDWLEGSRLDDFIAQHLNDSAALLELARQFLELATALRQANIAHGDLQHGNLLVVNGKLRLLDYDGMFVPALAGRPSNELGQPNYQHPIRSAHDYGPALDNFSVWVITLSLLGLALEPSLRAEFTSGGEALLLRQSDFANPAYSKTLTALQQTNNTTLRFLTLAFVPYLFARDLDAIQPPDPNALAVVQAATPPKAGLPDWLRDRVGAPMTAPAQLAPAAPTAPGADWLLDHLEPAASPRLNGSFRFEKVVLVLVTAAFVLLVGIFLLGPLPPLVGLSILSLLPLTAVLALSIGFSLRYNSPNRRDAVRAVQELERARSSYGAKLQELTMARTQLERAQQDEMAKLVKQQSANAAQEKTELVALEQSLQSELAQLDVRCKRLTEQEAATLAAALEKFRAHEMERQLETYRIADAMLPGIISRELKQNLARHGFVTAADLADFQVNWLNSRKRFWLVHRRGASVFVEGISPERGVALILWQRAMRARVQSKLPDALSADMLNALRKKFKDEQVNLQLAELKQKQETQIAKTRLVEAARKEHERLTRAMQELPAVYQRKLQGIEQEFADARKTLVETEWSLTLARRHLQTFAHINFSNYLKSIFGR